MTVAVVGRISNDHTIATITMRGRNLN